jgi:hypothetical protein
VRQGLETFRPCLSKPQYQHFVTVLLGLLLCQEARTLSGVLRGGAGRGGAGGPSLASVSRFLAHAPWQPAARVQTWLGRFRMQRAPLVQAERQRQRQACPPRRGRPPEPVVAGYLIGDDSTVANPKGKLHGGQPEGQTPRWPTRRANSTVANPKGKLHGGQPEGQEDARTGAALLLDGRPTRARALRGPGPLRAAGPALSPGTATLPAAGGLPGRGRAFPQYVGSDGRAGPELCTGLRHAHARAGR